MKKCKTCGVQKDLSEFYANRGMADGRLRECKRCMAPKFKAYKASRPEAVRAWNLARTKDPKFYEANAAYLKEWRRKFPERSRAEDLLYKAVKRGEVERLPCFICGETAEAHHPDYSAPLSVVWLCSSHHKQAHALVRDLYTLLPFLTSIAAQYTFGITERALLQSARTNAPHANPETEPTFEQPRERDSG